MTAMQSRRRERGQSRKGIIGLALLMAASAGMIGCVVSEKSRYEQHLSAVVQPAESPLHETVAMFHLHAMREAAARAQADSPDE